MRSLFCTIFLVLATLSSVLAGFVVPPVTLPATKYQKWAHYHWAWVKNSDGNQQNVTNLYQGYFDHHIPLGAINIDSTWATQFNNFEVDTTRFPDFAGLVKDLHDHGLKVILWATSMVNTENPDFEMAVSKSYLVKTKNGRVVPLKWWHGAGGLLDYTNPEAVAWWHSLMDKVLDVGVDGFKCDGTDPYIMEYSLAGGAYGYDGQLIDYPQYAHMYYRDFFYYTREKRSDASGDAGLIMSRPVDCLADKVSKGCTPFSPRDVMYSGWVGDDDGSFEGMRGCMHKAIYSAWSKYANFGCDVGGYRDRGSEKNVFIRWAQLGSFLPLMENGGGGEHRPWKFDDETVTIYRKFAVQHHRLASYLHTTGANAVDNVVSSLRPVDEETVSINATDGRIRYPQPKTFSYRLGDDILVHPVMFDAKESQQEAAKVGIDFDASKNESVVHMVFPTTGSEDNTLWLDWWRPNEMKKSHKAGDKALRIVPFDSYPVYVRQGALIPLHTISVDAADKTIERIDDNHVSFTWFHPFSCSSTKTFPAQYQMRESASTGTGLQAKAYFADGNLVAEVSSHSGNLGGGFSFVGVSKPSSKDDVQIESLPTALCQHVYEPLEKTLRVSCQNLLGGLRVTVANPSPSYE